MKVIDLLNKLANGEEVPNKIKYCDEILTYDKEIDNYRYRWKDEYWSDGFIIGYDLNDEIEIIEVENER